MLVAQNGSIAELDALGLRLVGQVAVGRVHLRGRDPVLPHALRERERLAATGLIAIVLRLNQAGKLRERPDVTSLGLTGEPKAVLALLEDVAAGVYRALCAHGASWSAVSAHKTASRTATRFLADTGRRGTVVHLVVLEDRP